MNRIVNISATFNFGVHINLDSLKALLPSSKYDPRTFSGLIFRYQDLGFTATIFKNGYVVITGTKSIEDTEMAAAATRDLINDCGYSVRINELELQNIVGAGDFGIKINLEELYERLRKFSADGIIPSLELELFPGLICRFKDTKLSVTIFRSGKFFITGCKKEIEITRIEEMFEKYIQKLEWE